MKTSFCLPLHRKQKQLRKNDEYYMQSVPLNKQGTIDVRQFRTIQSNHRPATLSHHRTASQGDWKPTTMSHHRTGSDWTSLRLPQNANLMMTSMTSSMGGDTVYDVVPNTDDIQRNANLI